VLEPAGQRQQSAVARPVGHEVERAGTESIFWKDHGWRVELRDSTAQAVAAAVPAVPADPGYPQAVWGRELSEHDRAIRKALFARTAGIAVLYAIEDHRIYGRE